MSKKDHLLLVLKMGVTDMMHNAHCVERSAQSVGAHRVELAVDLCSSGPHATLHEFNTMASSKLGPSFAPTRTTEAQNATSQLSLQSQPRKLLHLSSMSLLLRIAHLHPDEGLPLCRMSPDAGKRLRSIEDTT